MSKPQQVLDKFLQDNESDHYDFTPDVDYLISTGSLKLDRALGGGLGPGVHRFLGASEGGKTSCALKVAQNFLKTVPNSRVVIIKAEGRLSKKMMRKSKLKFAKCAKDWDVGTAYIFKCNIFDTAANFIDTLIHNNEEDCKYLFLIDSMDGLILKDDMAKKIGDGDHTKVMGPQVLTKLLLKRTSLPMSELGHMLIMISQIIAKMDNKYEKKEQLPVSGSGGNAIIHFANWILVFKPKFKKHMITNDGKDVVDDFDDSNIAGHWCRVTLDKSDNEQTSKTVSYPIKYGNAEEDSIWSEFEIENFLTAWKFIVQKGSWYNMSEKMIQMMEEGIPWFEVKNSQTGETKYTHIEPKISAKDKKLITVEKVKWSPPGGKTSIQGKPSLINFISLPEVKEFWFNHFQKWARSDEF